MQLRLARCEDSQEILNIYGKYIQETAVSFEIAVPSVGDFALRMEKIMSTFPYLVCEEGGQVVGYAYASLHGERAAFRYDVDLSIYMADTAQHTGQAKALYTTLFSLLRAQGFYNAYASYTEPNEKSRRFHEKLGFHPVGTFSKAGYKLGTWHDLTWMSLALQDHEIPPKDIIPIHQLPPQVIETCLTQEKQGNSQ